MSIDRAETLRNAEKLLRQGRLESAIEEYLRVVENHPRDWNTANTLGDLYVRTGRADMAVEQFTRIADSLSREGFFSKASALYKKILKIHPSDEHALTQAAQIAARQGLLVDARAYLNTVCEHQRGRGDFSGVAKTMSRLAALIPENVEAAGDSVSAPPVVAPAEAIAAIEPIEPDQRLTPIETGDSIDPIAPIETGEPIDPIAPIETGEPIDPIAPSESSGPTDPEPFVESQPSSTTEPIAPAMPKEIDLTVVLSRIGRPAPLPTLTPKDLDTVFAEMRDEASRHPAPGGADQDFARGLAFYDAGQVDDAVIALEAAARAPRWRFQAAGLLGRICLSRGITWQAIEWFERAAEAPAPTAEDGHRLLFELADALEAVGELARALAICLELQADAGEYEDVADRIDRLARVQTRG